MWAGPWCSAPNKKVALRETLFCMSRHCCYPCPPQECKLEPLYYQQGLDKRCQIYSLEQTLQVGCHDHSESYCICSTHIQCEHGLYFLAFFLCTRHETEM